MTAELSDGCCRCGGHVLRIGGGPAIRCTSSTCLALWADTRSFENECVARDLAGTRVRSTDAKIDSLEKKTDELEMKIQLQELVELVRKNTRQQVLGEVHRAIGLSMKGRDTSTVKGTVEIELLIQMQNWIKRSMNGNDD